MGRVNLMRMGTTYISEFKKKEKNVVVVAPETINVARFKKKIKTGIFKLHFQK
jgi:hypothetical protein